MEKDTQEIIVDDRKYRSILSKNALTYNLAYHLSNMTEKDNPYEIIYNILDKMEDNSSKNS